MLRNKSLVAKIGFDTAENGPSKVSVTGIPVDRYRYTGIGIARTGVSQAKRATPRVPRNPAHGSQQEKQPVSGIALAANEP